MLLNFNQLKNQFKIQIEGIIHVGGHIGDELGDYLGIDNLIIFEPQPHCFEQLTAKARSLSMTPILVNKALGNFVGEAKIKSDKTGLIGSLLEPGLVLGYPDCDFTEEFMVDVSTLDTEIAEDHPYNLLNMDVQGYELEVLKGGTKVLEKIQYVYTEVNRAEVYKNCAMIEELDEFLAQYNLARVAERWRGDWGDAFYVKK